MELACVILAAGAGRRFGGDKMRFRIRGKQSLIELTAELYLSVFDEISVVASPSQIADHPLQGQHNIRLITAAHAQLGISQSLIAGVQANADAQGLLIALGDMPYVQQKSVQLLCRAAEPGRITVPVSSGQQGNPVIFSKHYFPQLQELSGDTGAKSLIERYPERVTQVAMPDRGILRDIDQRSDIY
ncbi:MAG: nucleotidyltransferase family protein [Gammaproteobacteria bacterium]|nr:nucleotidyltransferase family protein [Gammaproteobacteria bacterium]